MRLLFCLFADSIGLLPDQLFRKMIEIDRGNPRNFNRKLRQSFRCHGEGRISASTTSPGSTADFSKTTTIIELSASDLAILAASATLDWSRVEPAIFGTLFERSFDPTKRSQLGAHYTSKEDILTIIEPVLIAPLREALGEGEIEGALGGRKGEEGKGVPSTSSRGSRTKLRSSAGLKSYRRCVCSTRLAEAATSCISPLSACSTCGKRRTSSCAQHGLPRHRLPQVTPLQLYGIEKNTYAHDWHPSWSGLVISNGGRTTAWASRTEPILEPLSNISTATPFSTSIRKAIQ